MRRLLLYLAIGTLSGLLVRWLSTQEEELENIKRSLASVVNNLPQSDTAPVSTPRSARLARQAEDALVEIEGIGPVFEKALNSMGIRTFAELAEQDAETLAEKMNARITAERIRRERWIEQARERSKTG